MLEKNRPTICLNMIVKDESEIIENTLKMLSEKIEFSYWVICDTGSTDNTIEIIEQFFKEKNIPGELHKHTWKNFAHNRTLALNEAYNKTDYALIFDADDEIHGTINIPNIRDIDGYKLQINSKNEVSYCRIMLINNRIKWEYKSVVHEYIECLKPNPTIVTLEGDYYVLFRTAGNRSKDPDKYLKDAMILEEAYKDSVKIGDGLHLRYAFYCANSYRDYGNNEKAIEWYKITLSQENWLQEKYTSCLSLYRCYSNMKEKEKGLYYLVESVKYDCTRVECIYYLINHYCVSGMNEIAYNYYLNIKDTYENYYLSIGLKDKLFLENDIYNFYLPYYMIIVCDKVKHKHPSSNNTVYKMFEIIFKKKYNITSDFFIKYVFYNLQFFIENIVKQDNNFVSLFQSYIDFLENRNIDLSKYDFLEKYTKYGVTFNFKKITEEKLLKENINEEKLLKEPNNRNKLLDTELPIVLFHVLAKDKGAVLEYWLEQNLDNIDYPKDKIKLYIRTNNNNDNTQDILCKWLEKQTQNEVQWNDIYFDSSNVEEKVEQYGIHEWNSVRFSVLGKLREEGIKKAIDENVDFYFVCDVDNFLLPETLLTLVQSDVQVIAPLLKCAFNEHDNKKNVYSNKYYSNFHHPVTQNGYFISSDIYYEILNQKNPSLHEVDLVHCTYLVRKDVLNIVSYIDKTDDYEYVIFSRNLRKNGIKQFFDTRKVYGCLTLTENCNVCKEFMKNIL